MGRVPRERRRGHLIAREPIGKRLRRLKIRRALRTRGPRGQGNQGQAEETERDVDPYGLIFHAGVWYTVGYCHLRQDLRVFRLDRVLKVELLEEPFTRPPNFDSLDHLRRSMASMPGTWKVEVLLEMPWEEAERQVPPTMAMLEAVRNETPALDFDTTAMSHALAMARCRA